MSYLNIYQPGAPTQQTSPDTSTVRVFTPPNGCKGFVINCATTDCRITCDGTAVSSTVGLQIKAGASPAFFPFDVATSGLQAVSTAGTNSVIDVMFAT